MAKPLRGNIARLLSRLALIEPGGVDWIECNEASISYLRSVTHHKNLRDAGKFFTCELHVAVTTPAFSPQVHLLKITRKP
jgi:hypothetical protein